MKTNGQDKMSRTVRGALRSDIGALIERDVKNEGASGDLYENKDKATNCRPRIEHIWARCPELQRQFMQASAHFPGIGVLFVTDRAWASAIFVSKCRISGAGFYVPQIGY